MKKEYKEYNTKMIETPTTLEIWEYLNEPVVYSITDDKETNNNNGNIESVIEKKKPDVKQELNANRSIMNK